MLMVEPVTKYEREQWTGLAGADHLVFSSGGVYLIKIYGVVRQCVRDGYICPQKLKSICGTSAGIIIGAILAIAAIPGKTLDWEWLDDYMYTRDIIQVCMSDIATMPFSDMYRACGIFNKNFILKLFGPIFFHHGIRIETVTLAEYNQMCNGLSLVFLSTQYDTFQTVELSATTHPDMVLLDALYASSCIPFVHQPYVWTGSNSSQPIIYLDGGLRATYPMEYYKARLIQAGEDSPRIFGFCVQQVTVSTPITTALPDLVSFAAHIIRSITFASQPLIHKSTYDQFFISAVDGSVEANTMIRFDVRRQFIDAGSAEWLVYIATQRGVDEWNE